ncbi:MAG TPA: hypothetical protein PKM88_00510, partial [bacterium]|nr:hypothetical protein [bacterium]
MVDDELSAPERSTGDIVNSILKAGLSVIPFAGGPAAELFQFVFQPPLERRRFEWMVRVGELLRELKDDGIMIEDL